MCRLPPRPEPAAPRLCRTVANLAAFRAAGMRAADALVLEPAAFMPGIVARLRADRPDRAIYAWIDDADDPALADIAGQGPDGVLLRDARSGRDVAALGARLAVCEAEAGLPDGGIAVLATIRHPLGLLDALSFVGASPRLAGLGLDGAALAACIGAGSALAQGRDLIRIAAAAAGVTLFEVIEGGRGRGLTTLPQDGVGLLVLRASTD